MSTILHLPWVKFSDKENLHRLLKYALTEFETNQWTVAVVRGTTLLLSVPILTELYDIINDLIQSEIQYRETDGNGGAVASARFMVVKIPNKDDYWVFFYGEVEGFWNEALNILYSGGLISEEHKNNLLLTEET